ncbi:Panacea domain-containing protein [Bombilactobacillus mellis]|uniref:Panacea domain-containing protein n=1 Tax=Bombilactobacillus mellis TaxID=1218508 RepID=UPI00158026F4|nr:type II toxin-antitoxin system antitoxin SocA domain-containing protein [Bombilactobacillus mellis]MBI0107686.1 DUF4065 domain-containing protein [Lactobacillus sp. W8086]MBI0109152.1 DUF4065 domain-containing protein [Lactobacillus sp. W8085]MBI0112463.1 DUF4065 domain-containing protein [Lactobacillus sp. W8088]MBI0116084.1 DUF4065 domain-containing protein [Lactobacillus sp. W8087]MBI0119904.1 DUF4065 domain-containing protein [Lactobacillus sp. W8089]MBI0131869.1 DUF4065 domain-contain
MNIKDLSDHIIGLAQKNHIPITNLHLQKILYFTLKYCIKKNLFTEDQLEELYNEPFMVWRYGPVEKSIYDRYKIYGSYPITEEHCVNKEFENLNQIILTLLKRDPFELVRETHSEEYWQKNKEKIKGWRSDVSYSLSNIKNGY